MKLPYCIEELGCEFSRFSARDREVHCATWRDEHNSHIYMVEMQPHPCGWHATLLNDGREVGAVTAPSRSACAKMSMGAMRAYLLRGHRRTLRTLRKDAEESYAECHPYETDLLPVCGNDLNLAHAVEYVAIRRGYPADRLRGADFARILEMVVESVARANTPRITEGGAE